MPYQMLEHTADIRIRVTGKTLEELFKSALTAMAEIILPHSKNKPIITREISITAPDRTALLIDFLNEILTNSNIHKEIYSDVTFLKLTDNKIEAEIYGISTGKFHEDIKAVTFHEADIQRKEDGFLQTNIVFDI